MSQGMTYAQAQRPTRWHYQWLIVNDYLPRIVGKDVVSSLIKRDGTTKFSGTVYKPEHLDNPYMPIEYSGAAYRFGHSMIRAEYEMQDGHTVPIFGADGFVDLRGNRPIPATSKPTGTASSTSWGSSPRTTATWHGSSTASSRCRCSPRRHRRRTHRQGDHRAGRAQPAARQAARLPCGQDVATAMGITPLTNAQLGPKQPGWGGKAPLW